MYIPTQWPVTEYNPHKNILEYFSFLSKVKFVFFKFIYSEKATKFCEIFTLLLSYVAPVKSKVEISQNFVAFSEHMYEH